MKTLGIIISILLAGMLLNAQTSQNLNVNGTNRSMSVYARNGLPQNAALMITMHGMNQDVPYHISTSEWEQVADTANLLVVFPQGISNSWDLSGTRDTDFILAIIEAMYTQYGIDKNRVYLSGFSMGGMMTYHAATKIADQIAAFAPVSGYLMGGPNTNSSRPIPIIHTHGTSDDVVGYSNVQRCLDAWIQRNNCPTNAVVTDPYPTNKPNSTTTKYYWGKGDDGVEIVHMRLEGKGHWWSEDLAGGTHTSSEIWKFVRRYSLGPNGPSVKIEFQNQLPIIEPANVIINATATPAESPISKVEFFNGNTKLGEDASAPYSYTWNNVSAGSYTIRAVVTDNSGMSTESTATLKVNIEQAPYSGTPVLVTDRIEFEYYDLGGNGNAYYDSSPGSETGIIIPCIGGNCDEEDVDIEECTDVGGGYNVGWSTAGEWLEYTVSVPYTGTYDLELRVACNVAGNTVSVTYEDETAIANNIAIPNTGGWQVWETVTVNDVELQQGTQILRLTIGATDYVNLNYMTFIPQSTGPIIPGTGITPPSGSEFTTNDVVHITVPVEQGDAAIANVAVYVGTDLLSKDATAPYKFDWSPTSAGTYTLKIVATDVDNQVAEATVTYTVVQGVQLISLKAGWNMIGCPLSGSTDLETALSSIWQYVKAVKDMDEYYLEGQDSFLNTLTELKWGKGYFIQVETPCSLEWKK